MNYRIKNIKSGNFVSKPVPMAAAKTLYESVYSKVGGYQIVPFETEINKMSIELKPMEAIVINVIEYLKTNVLDYSTSQKTIVDALINRLTRNNLIISEKENYIMWNIIYDNRNNITDPKLLSIANQYFDY